MTQGEALKAFEEMYGEIDKENWLFVGTINPQMVEHAIKALSIIRCKDCKFFKTQFNEDGYYTTNCQFSKVAEVNGFCHMARRKEE